MASIPNTPAAGSIEYNNSTFPVGSPGLCAYQFRFAKTFPVFTYDLWYAAGTLADRLRPDTSNTLVPALTRLNAPRISRTLPNTSHPLPDTRSHSCGRAPRPASGTPRGGTTPTAPPSHARLTCGRGSDWHALLPTRVDQPPEVSTPRRPSAPFSAILSGSQSRRSFLALERSSWGM